MSDDSIGPRIASLVVATFNGLSLKSGKPATRSNGVREWTVLAGLVAVMSDDLLVPLALATGVKALPNKAREYSNGLMVHDMHAEVLVLRLFNWYLLEQCHLVKNSQTSQLVEEHNGGYRIRPGIQLALYISEPPCGDASMGALMEHDLEPWKKKQKLGQQVTRGRGHFDQLGVVRTKPGRNDSIPTLSKSCSDKLCERQLTGITNSWTSVLFPQGVYLDYLVLQRSKYSQVDCTRCFSRARGVQEAEFHPLEFRLYEKDDYEYHKPEKNDPSVVPSQLSLLYIVPSKTIQVLNNGVKNGSFVKNKPPKKGGSSLICNQQFHEKFGDLMDLEASTYHEFKQLNQPRCELKQRVRSNLGGWVPTDIDDFEL
ncbi:uncharacterized protein CANTADRAFT_46365 [Suhomyces tanzawaensis NRRL Y-17324]|uniref:A to I editase domain-containing protein n=1 Tax=Suhomyces tanzawaensis NRRL Y-17324 TaxID=984487 RepID=A0A1E4SP72_9ASCO|nr:uncharacterized protein CANTADRAFT_46365 [Suhomyces tanzawaensis NRRL Y-17324]ODV81278.1 hypothetical protein CANTADRAFT_46365 [Suhomyces tanzawaensis NRRL Y-17324]